jgi:DNA-binding LytR/AlgR family response regulator
MSTENKLTCVIVEDDLVFQTVIEGFIKKIDFLELKGVFNNAISAGNFLSSNDVDIILLDIEMPEMSGLELLESLESSPQVIITSGHKDYAIEAFSFNVTDFLLKPIDSYPRFIKAINRAKKNIEGNEKVDKNSGTLFIKVDSRLVRIFLNDIYYIEAYGDYVRVNTKDQVHIVYSSLKLFMKDLPDKEFIQVHRSYVIRDDKIISIDGNMIKVKDKVVPISRSYREAVLGRIKTI